MSPTFVTNETKDEDILFASFGSIKKGQDPKKSMLVKEGESIIGVVKEINDSAVYKKIYRLKVDKIEPIVVILGKTDLVNRMGHGTKKADIVVKVGDLVQITFNGIIKTGKGRPFNKFTVGVAQ